MRLNAFTLIELLVVVTIIVVLLALLTPALDKAISSAGSVVCGSNLHQWGLATRQYAMDHKGGKVRFVTSIRHYWWNPLSTYIGEPGFAKRPLGTLVLKANLCPEAPMRPNEGRDVPGGLSVEVGGTGYNTGTKWGSARQSWQWGASTIQNGPPLADTAFGSYGMNLWVADVDQNSGFPQDQFYGKYNNTPGDVPLLGDCNWVGSWPDDKDLPSPDTDNGNASGDASWSVGGLMGRYVLNRHDLGRMTMNLGYVDGSALNTRLGDLWMQPWHRTFEKSDGYRDDYR